MKSRLVSIVNFISISVAIGLCLYAVVACQPASSAIGHVEDVNEVPSGSAPAELATPTSLDSSILAITQTPTSLLAEEAAPEPTGMPDIQLCSPLSMHPIAELPQIISDPYKPPPPNRPEERHHGVDFSYWHYEDRDSMLGEPVQAILTGVVASSIQDLYPYGNMVIIETKQEDLPREAIAKLQIKEGESLYHLYAHMNLPPAVSLGETISVCQPLGEVGMSGNTDISHLHLETRLGPAGSVFESMRFYDTRASIEEMETYLMWRTSGIYQHFDPMILLNYPVFP